MSSAGIKCPSCGSSNVVDDVVYCQPQTVCVDCGSVVSEGVLCTSDRHVGCSDVSYSRSAAPDKTPCVNLVKGLQRVRTLCLILRVRGDIEDLSQTYFNQVYQHKTFINVSLQKKEILAGCSVLISCRLLNWPITMGTITYLLDADPTMVGPVYKEMIKILNIQSPVFNFTDVMESHSQEYKLNSPHVPEEYHENSRDLSKRAVDLAELAADSWIVTGRKPLPIMMAAIYLAWQSLKPTRTRLKISLDKFCHIAKVNKHKPAVKRISEIKEVLCKLGKEIPWVREAVTADNVLHHVEDILKYRYVLLKRALRSHEEALQAEVQDSGGEPLNTGTAPDSVDLPGVSNQEVSVAKTAQDNGDNKSVFELDSNKGTQDGRDPEPNWGKRVLFSPPCVSNAKKMKVDVGEFKDVTGDEEISDSEIDSYIRTPLETQNLALAHKHFSSLKNEKS
ncbi:transcription factor IIIB 50 kDa subunit [Sphaeramia orbicularis]|uniref:Transcription factor IIIB 50 kDa subunit n=1 Tax=Sphaeramia orbicularis TaxID=375764 RepID=A0A673B1M4_9TELE|nr:transcription factor IIIB 50 kDa subunit [Sphaeramia orbicularis]